MSFISIKVMIFDFGGGTLDIVVLAIERGIIDIKAVGGDNHLGGDDIDNNIAQYCLKEFRLKTKAYLISEERIFVLVIASKFIDEN
jgi:L1 cell adhesion molecule like protein